MPTSFVESRRAVLDAQKALRTDARSAGMSSSLPLFASNYLLNQADIGMGCALGTGGGMVKALVRPTRLPTYGTTCWPSSSRVNGKAKPPSC